MPAVREELTDAQRADIRCRLDAVVAELQTMVRDEDGLAAGRGGRERSRRLGGRGQAGGEEQPRARARLGRARRGLEAEDLQDADAGRAGAEAAHLRPAFPALRVARSRNPFHSPPRK